MTTMDKDTIDHIKAGIKDVLTAIASNVNLPEQQEAQLVVALTAVRDAVTQVGSEATGLIDAVVEALTHREEPSAASDGA